MIETGSAVRSRLLDTPEVAERLGLSTATLATWRGKGAGPDFVRVGRQVRYPEAAVDAFLAAGLRQSAA